MATPIKQIEKNLHQQEQQNHIQQAVLFIIFCIHFLDLTLFRKSQAIQ